MVKYGREEVRGEVKSREQEGITRPSDRAIAIYTTTVKVLFTSFRALEGTSPPHPEGTRSLSLKGHKQVTIMPDDIKLVNGSQATPPEHVRGATLTSRPPPRGRGGLQILSGTINRV